MHRFFLPPAQCKDKTLFLTGGEAHHALRVLRVRSGERVTVLDGAGREYLCKVAVYDRDRVRLDIDERRALAAPPARITLLQALPKGKIFETIIQKATELGVWRVVPLLTERVATRIGKPEGTRKAEKWRLIAIEAIKQCGAGWLPQIEIPLAPEEFLTRQERFELPLIASLQPGGRHPRERFQAFQESHHRLPGSVCIWIGPEGDFTPAEVETIQSAGALPITLGPRVLRTDTAALYCLSVLNYELTAANENY
jgi:16S rRNA (uracil1498-N3)-methyltransferase